MKSSLLIALALLLTHCNQVERREREFDDVELGMAKSEVLQIAGPPLWSDRKAGHDRWIYYMQPERRQRERIIYFKHGVVVRKGQRDKPTLSAEEMEAVKKPRLKTKPHKPKYTDEQLKALIKKEIKKEEKKKKANGEDSKLERL